MSEIKRVAFTTISTSSTSSSVNSNIGGSGGLVASSFSASGGNDAVATSSAALHRFGVPDPVTSQKSGVAGSSSASTATSKLSHKTIRLNMELFASNSNSFPEFNYSKLIHLEKKKLKKLKSNKQNGFSEPFEENDDDVARIAKELEKKYGTSYASGRGRSKKDDFCDIGLGYDENDSFIDNTEAYDEIIPEEVETVEGGFYINSGALVFKHLSCTEKTDEIIKMPNKPRKRALSTSSEESGSSDEEKDTEKDTDGPTTVTTSTVANSQQQSAISKISTNSSNKQKNSHPSEKRHKTSSDKESSDKEKSSKSSKSSAASSTATSSVTSLASGSPKNDDIASEPSSKDKQRGVDRTTVKTTTVKDMLKAKRDSFLKMQEEELKSKTSNGEPKTTTSTDNQSGSDSSSDESDSNMEPNSKKLKKSDEDTDKLRSSDTPLPDLNDDLLRDVQNIKDTAKASNRIGKKFQFDEKLTDLFLSVDERCLCLDRSLRNNVLAHLEYQLSLPKNFLLRKAKQLRINQEKSKTKKAFVKLRKAVSEVMQNISQQYQTNLAKYEEFQSLNPGSDTHKLENAPKMPKKRFHWNETTRSLLYELYQVRWMSFTVLRTRKESFEDFVSNFLKEKVINIWPSGWMKLEEVKREIEKKKNAPKKLKENKKPEESLPTFSSTSDKSQSHNHESATSSTSKLSINTTDNHPTTTSSSEVAIVNLKSNDVAKLIPAQNNSTSATTEHMHSSKAYSSSSTSSGKNQRSSTNSPLNLCSSQSGSKSDKLSSGSTVINNNNNVNPNQNLNTNRPSSTGIVNMSKNLIDLVSPSKRTDHSINSIMSSPSSTSSSVSTTPQPQHSAAAGAMGSSLSSVDNNTHVINIDNFKSVSDIINTSNQLMHSHGSKTHSQNDRQKGGRSSTLDVHHSHNHGSMKTEFNRRDSSSESDGVEIVGVYQAPSTTASTLPVVSKNKYKKSSHHGSRSDSPGLHDKLKTAASTVASKKPHECTELDVNKIMKALKELEELQQTGNYVPDISSFANSNHNANTSPLAYGKDLTQ